MMQCLAEIVGVSNSDCACITDGLTDQQKAGIKKSTSGLYMDDLPGGVHLKALDSIDACADLAILALQERDNAIKTLEDDLVVALNNQYKKAKPNFAGQVGRMNAVQSLNVNGQYQGVRLRPVDYGDGVLTLKRITLIVNTSATFNISLYRANFGERDAVKLNDFPITTVAHNYATIDIAANADPKLAGLKLPLTINSQSVEYFLLYDRVEAGGAVPKDNSFECSTCGDKNNRPSTFIDAKGVQFNNLADFTNTAADNYAHGFILDVAIKCDNEQLFCREYSADDAVAITMARAVHFKAGELLIEAVIKSTEVNRYTTMAREYLWGKRNHFRAEYESRIVYLAASIDVSASNCFVCREGQNQPFVTGIFS